MLWPHQEKPQSPLDATADTIDHLVHCALRPDWQQKEKPDKSDRGTELCVEFIPCSPRTVQCKSLCYDGLLFTGYVMCAHRLDPESGVATSLIASFSIALSTLAAFRTTSCSNSVVLLESSSKAFSAWSNSFSTKRT